MASHHHHHHHHRHHHQNHRESIPVNYSTSSPCNCCVDSTPSPRNLDHLLRLVVSYLQTQQQQGETQCSCETLSPRFKRQSFVPKKEKNVQREYDNLLRKIDELEFLLSRRESNSTLKDSAARVIQTHFRSYLVRRSVSLRQLKELALIKSSFSSLKSSVSGKTHFPFEAVSREATDLLLQLDSIQGRVDSMIRDGKRSLCRDLVRFLHYVDGCVVKRRIVVCKSVKDVTFRAKRNVDRTTEKLRKQMGSIYVTSNGDEEDIAELEEFHFISDDAQEIPILSVESSRKVGSSKSRVGALGQGDKVKTLVTKRVKFGKDRNVYELTTSAEDDSFDDGVGSHSRTRNGSGVVVKDNGGKTGVMKSVRFDEDGNVYKVYGDTPEASVSGGDESSTSTSSNENGDGYNEVEDIKSVRKVNEGFKEEDEETYSENEDDSSSQDSKEEAHVSENASHMGRNEHKREFHVHKGSSMFSPPLPLKMEP